MDVSSDNQGSESDRDDQSTQPQGKCFDIRNIIGFFLLGLCNNYGYVIMLSAANDILHDNSNNGTNLTTIPGTTGNLTGKLIPHCNKIGTGVILLADILPALILKITAPWYILLIPYSVRVISVVSLAAGSYILVAVFPAIWVKILGVVFASLSSGLGEITFLALTSKFSKTTVSAWSSGTGAAGLFGALSYAGLTALGVTPRDTILIMLIIPAILAVSYFILLLENPTEVSMSEQSSVIINSDSNANDSETDALLSDVPENEVPVSSMTFTQRLVLVKPLLKYMVPLALVYFAEYFINQALFELIIFEGIKIPVMQQYRWYQALYQLGVFISRSSVGFVKIKHIWVFAVVQFGLLALFMLEIFLGFLPYIWIILILITVEGLMGGGAYVNSFYRITVENERQDVREYSMGVASMSDSLGISLAGAVSLPVHNYLCSL